MWLAVSSVRFFADEACGTNTSDTDKGPHSQDVSPSIVLRPLKKRSIVLRAALCFHPLGWPLSIWALGVMTKIFGFLEIGVLEGACT
jgi:hypothetical protein